MPRHDADDRRDDHDDHDDDTDEDREDDFPLGDGDADLHAVVYCPYCNEPNDVTVDPGSGEEQEYVEDCQVCCRPWWVVVSYDRNGRAHVEVRREND